MDKELKELLSLNGTRTLLTGAFGGLGFGILNLFLENGQHVTATSRRNHEKFDANKAVEIVKVDLNDEEAVTSFAKNTEPFDNVVICHGISGLRPIPMLTPAYSREIFQTNFVSKTHLVSALIKNKKISSPGRLVNVSSISAHYGSKHVAIYSSSNAAGESFMRSVGKAFLKKKSQSTLSQSTLFGRQSLKACQPTIQFLTLRWDKVKLLMWQMRYFSSVKRDQISSQEKHYF